MHRCRLIAVCVYDPEVAILLQAIKDVHEPILVLKHRINQFILGPALPATKHGFDGSVTAPPHHEGI